MYTCRIHSSLLVERQVKDEENTKNSAFIEDVHLHILYNRPCKHYSLCMFSVQDTRYKHNPLWLPSDPIVSHANKDQERFPSTHRKGPYCCQQMAAVWFGTKSCRLALNSDISSEVIRPKTRGPLLYVQNKHGVCRSKESKCSVNISCRICVFGVKWSWTCPGAAETKNKSSVGSMWAATKKVIMFEHLRGGGGGGNYSVKIADVFSNWEKKGVESLLSFSVYLPSLKAAIQRVLNISSLSTGAFEQLQNQQIEPLNNVSAVWGRKMIWLPLKWLPNWRRGRFEWNPKTEKKTWFLSDIEDNWIDCFSDTNGQILERKGTCVVTVGLIMWRPLGRLVRSGRVGWLVVIAIGHAWLDSGQRHSHTPLWGN